jgi:hypothetical protein
MCVHVRTARRGGRAGVEGGGARPARAQRPAHACVHARAHDSTKGTGWGGGGGACPDHAQRPAGEGRGLGSSWSFYPEAELRLSREMVCGEGTKTKGTKYIVYMIEHGIGPAVGGRWPGRRTGPAQGRLGQPGSGSIWIDSCMMYTEGPWVHLDDYFDQRARYTDQRA